MSQKSTKLKGIQAITNLDSIPQNPQSARVGKRLTKVISFLSPGNDEPQRLIGFYERSATHRTAINTQHTYTVGKGLVIKRKDGEEFTGDDGLEKYMANVNNQNESLYDVYKKAALDYIVVGNNSLQVNRFGTATNIFHQDVSEARKTPSLDEIIIAADWEVIKTDAQLKKAHEKEMAFTWPVYTEKQEGTSILYNTGYSIGRRFYGLPKYYSMGALEWINIEYQIPSYNSARIENKFMPSGVLSLFGEPPKGFTHQQWASTVKDSFTGHDNASKLLITSGSDPELAPSFAEISDEPDGIYQTLDELAIANILRAHGLHPSLLMSTEGSLGQASEIRTIHELYMNTVIRNTQQATLKPFNRILADQGFNDVFLEVEQLKPVSLMDLVTNLDEILSVEEQREIIGFKPQGDVNNS